MTEDQNGSGDLLERLQNSDSLPEALEITSEDVDTIGALAAALYEEGKLGQAEVLLQGLVALHPERAEFWSALGATMVRQDRWDEALPALSVALELDPDDTSTLVNRGECYLALADNEAAAADFERAMELDPKEEDPSANRARQMAFGMFAFFEECHEAGLHEVEVEDD
jgi:Flp pilus assembly protein TadD